MRDCITLEDTQGNRKLLIQIYEHKIDNESVMLAAYVAYKHNKDAFE